MRQAVAERETERETETETETETGTERQRGRGTEGQRDRETDRDRQRHRKGGRAISLWLMGGASFFFWRHSTNLILKRTSRGRRAARGAAETATAKCI